MKVYKESVLALASAFVGYCEKGNNSNLLDFTNGAGDKNFTRFADELDQIGYWNHGDKKKNGFEWCAPFLNWLVWIASGKDVDKTKEVMCIPADEENLAAGCEYIRSYFRSAGLYDACPAVGALIIFTTTKGSVSADHIGIVSDISIDGTKIYTIEGNKDNKVSECVYPKDYWKVLGFCHPRYDDADAELEDLQQDYVELLQIKAEQEERLAELESKLAKIKSIIEETPVI